MPNNPTNFEARLDRFKYALYAVTDRTICGTDSLEAQVEAAIQGGASMVQIREKGVGFDDYVTRALALKEITSRYGVPLIVNDDVNVAKAIDATGVHVGQSDMACLEARRYLGPKALIGVSVSDVEQAIKAEREGADYLGVGAVFPTGTKADAQQVSHNMLKRITQAVRIPVVAIGGIGHDNIEQLAGTGLAGVSVVSSIFGSGEALRTKEDTKRLLSMTQEFLGLKMNRVKAVLTIAGSDCSGGAGIQADLKTIAAHGLYGMSVITALTAQNTCGVSAVHEVPADFVNAQLKAIFDDIKPDAIKIGMVSSEAIISAVASQLTTFRKSHPNVQVVIDPVMVATSGSKLISDGALSSLKSQLLPLATLITPNIHEAEILSDRKITTKQDMIMAAQAISQYYEGDILIKGGHLDNCSDDLLYFGDTTISNTNLGDPYIWFEQKRLETQNTHGTGCTLSSALACSLANGVSVQTGVKQAKAYVTGALYTGLELGKGNGPLHHGW